MKNALGSFLLTATLLGTAGGCVVEARGHVSAPPPPVAVVEVEVEEEPPPPRAVVVETRPGFVFVQGRWFRRGGRWEWSDGHWERERAGQVWVAGRWERGVGAPAFSGSFDSLSSVSCAAPGTCGG